MSRSLVDLARVSRSQQLAIASAGFAWLVVMYWMHAPAVPTTIGALGGAAWVLYRSQR